MAAGAQPAGLVRTRAGRAWVPIAAVTVIELLAIAAIAVWRAFG